MCIDTTDRQILKHLFLGPIKHQFGVRIQFFHETLVGSATLQANTLAFQAFHADFQASAFLGDEFGWRIVIFVTEINAFLAFFSDRHRRDDCVKFLRQQRRDHAVPILLDQHTLAVHLRTDCMCDIYIKALQGAVGFFPGEWRISALHADP